LVPANEACGSRICAAKGVEGVLEEPAASTLVGRIDESAIALTVQGWVDQRKSDFHPSRPASR
jgi:hypothetical protein